MFSEKLCSLYFWTYLSSSPRVRICSYFSWRGLGNGVFSISLHVVLVFSHSVENIIIIRHSHITKASSFLFVASVKDYDFVPFKRTENMSQLNNSIFMAMAVLRFLNMTTTYYYLVHVLYAVVAL